ncbi:hypothetical protein I9054_012360 [Acinetobacter bereziniae]|uniref:Uncharacterized protein n=1 Tax=Acinetobacter bereziniae TaxID=106648 RepID=A0A8I1AG02_ACIBZ|nr:hypothetical protein [Acinetobacter bereziniae]QQC83025.1 hypothetical protein I9190_11940 [Acinetobacter bereziniae]UUN96176.1 hypothetical protein I9054_012360 [Acinetobacter bereziniae]
MIEKPEIDHYLLEEIQEELAPRVIGNCGHITELSKEKVSSLYHALSIFLSRNTDSKLIAKVAHSLGEVP